MKLGQQLTVKILSYSFQKNVDVSFINDNWKGDDNLEKIKTNFHEKRIS